MKSFVVLRGRGARLLIFVFISFGFIAHLQSQGSAGGYLYVYPQNATCYPVGTSIQTQNVTLNGLFANYQVVVYRQAFPGAKTPDLDNAYEIHLNGNLDNLAAALENTGFFSSVEKAQYMYTLGSEREEGPAISRALPLNFRPSPSFRI